MKTSYDNLKEIALTFQAIGLGSDGSGLYLAGSDASIISEYFLNSNEMLRDAWKKVEETCKKVDWNISESVRLLGKDLISYAEQHINLELLYASTLNKVNEQSDSVLNQLGILDK